jgi:beta-galactosidase
VIGDFVWTAWDYLGESGIGKVDIDTLVPFFMANVWPHHLAECGDIDICGTFCPLYYN